jgi:hypothetical protein
MSAFSPEEIKAFEKVKIKREREAELNYLFTGIPLRPEHEVWLQEQERRRGGGGAGTHLNTSSQPSPRQETYQQQNYGTPNPLRNAVPSNNRAVTESYPSGGYTTGDSQAYSIRSPDQQPLANEGTPATTMMKQVSGPPNQGPNHCSQRHDSRENILIVSLSACILQQVHRGMV